MPKEKKEKVTKYNRVSKKAAQEAIQAFEDGVSFTKFARDKNYEYHALTKLINGDEELRALKEEAKRKRNEINREDFNEAATNGLRHRLEARTVYEIEVIYEPVLGPDGEPELEYQTDEHGDLIMDEKGLAIPLTYKDDRGVEMPVQKMYVKQRKVKKRQVEPDSRLIEFQLTNGMPEQYGSEQAEHETGARVFAMQDASQIELSPEEIGEENQRLLEA